MARINRPRTRPASRHVPSRRPLWIGGALLLALVAGLVWWSTRSNVPAFDGERAHADVVAQTAFGPRVPGTPAHDATLRWLVARLDSLAPRVVEQPVAFRDPGDSTRVLRGTNVVASFAPDAPRRIMLAAHWDSRPVADEDADPAKRTQPVLGANDGASGVAVLLEMARLLQTTPLPEGTGVDLVLFDLEDLGEHPDHELEEEGIAQPELLPFAIGSREFVRTNPTYRPAWGVLLDMVGDPGLLIPQEGYSVRYARPVVERVWAAARRVGADAFADNLGPAIEDDHVPFLAQGIPVIDLIHVPFPNTWHTTQDTPENVSPASLGQVGRVLVELLWGEVAP
jgi:hypothetical protein